MKKIYIQPDVTVEEFILEDIISKSLDPGQVDISVNAPGAVGITIASSNEDVYRSFFTQG
ncbi:MAG: hypothetical protein ACI4CT_09510 [Lachnospiraceae bacterium]